MRWAGFVPVMEEKRNVYEYLVVKLQGRGQLKDLCVDGNLALKCTVKIRV
jgi:hypothetical protein